MVVPFVVVKEGGQMFGGGMSITKKPGVLSRAIVSDVLTTGFNTM